MPDIEYRPSVQKHVPRGVEFSSIGAVLEQKCSVDQLSTASNGLVEIKAVSTQPQEAETSQSSAGRIEGHDGA
jgi:hypothetical protein